MREGQKKKKSACFFSPSFAVKSDYSAVSSSMCPGQISAEVFFANRHSKFQSTRRTFLLRNFVTTPGLLKIGLVVVVVQLFN